jgi:PAS domain S-box-containing protein
MRFKRLLKLGDHPVYLLFDYLEDETNLTQVAAYSRKDWQMATLATVDAQEMLHDLHQARENFGTIFQASPAILCIIQLNSLRYSDINHAYEQCTGYRRAEVIGKASLKLGLWSTVEDRDRMFRSLLTHGRVPQSEQVFQTRSGESLITLLSAEIIQFDGRPCALVTAEDITVRKQAEEARLVLSQRLINAQEAESRRVGQELHDSINQSLAMLIMDLERTRMSLTDSSLDTVARLARLSGKLKEVSQDVSNLSHRLHSSKLDLLGLGVAAKALSREFSEQSEINAHCECSGVPEDLSPEVSLCFFRVMQEALHNIAKHSQATEIDIQLNGTCDFLHLTISDNGVGFVQNATKQRPGLGLISMCERLHLIGGKLMITTKPGSGTRIEAILPMTNATAKTVDDNHLFLLDPYQPERRV